MEEFKKEFIRMTSEIIVNSMTRETIIKALDVEMESERTKRSVKDLASIMTEGFEKHAKAGTSIPKASASEMMAISATAIEIVGRLEKVFEKLYDERNEEA